MAEAARDTVLEVEGLIKDFGSGDNVTRVLHGIDLRVLAGELIAVIGPSGSGKSTLLNIIGLLMPASVGALRVAGRDVASMDDAALTRFRGEHIGFVFQFHHLISGFTAAENLVIPLAIPRGRVVDGMREKARAALVEVGLPDKMDARPSQMSGGEQQRVSVARALIGQPPLVSPTNPRSLSPMIRGSPTAAIESSRSSTGSSTQTNESNRSLEEGAVHRAANHCLDGVWRPLLRTPRTRHRE